MHVCVCGGGGVVSGWVGGWVCIVYVIYIHMYTYIHICIHVYTYIHIYIHVICT